VASAAQQQYLARVKKRVRRADLAVLSRLVGLQTAWGVALLAGAAVSLVQAIESATALSANGARWITALLGFVVVVAQGATQLLARTSGVVTADDEMRRNLARERRLFECGGAPYGDAVDPFALFVERAEAELAKHDGHVAAYSAALLRNGS
jgi:hypothetical protein